MKNSNPTEFSLDLLVEVAQGDDVFIRDMIALFLKKAPEMLNSIQTAFNEKDFAQCSSEAHKLKSSIQIIGSKSLQKIVKMIEKEAKKEQVSPELALNIDELNVKMEELFSFLNNRLTDPTKFS